MSTPNNPGEFPTYPTGPSYGSGGAYGGGMGQPGYGQPPMGQPPMYGQPMMPPAAPAKKSRKRLWITLGVIAGVLVLACGGIGFFLFSLGQAVAQPITVATTFCTDLKTQNYTAAYGLLSSKQKGQATQDLFSQGAKLQDQVDGQVTGCTLQSNSSAGFQFDSSKGTATLPATVQRTQAWNGKLKLVKEGSDWKIDDIDASLQGRDIAPIVVGNVFCQALASGDFHTAYATFSSHLQSQSTEEQFQQSFVAAFQQAGVQIKVVGCTPKFGSYTVSDTSATLDSSLDISANGTTVSVGTRLSFVKEGGVWKIDNLDVSQN
jgi:uncharacterized protein DUF3828